MFFLLLGGVWADRIPRRVILVGADLLRGFAQAGTAVLLFSGHADLWNVAVLQTLFGVATAFSRPANLGLLQEAVSQDRLQEANAPLGLSRSTLFVIGPAIGALVVAVANPASSEAPEPGARSSRHRPSARFSAASSRSASAFGGPSLPARCSRCRAAAVTTRHDASRRDVVTTAEAS